MKPVGVSEIQRIMSLSFYNRVVSPGGFPRDGAVCVPSWDRAGLERLVRKCYCGPPIFAGEGLA